MTPMTRTKGMEQIRTLIRNEKTAVLCGAGISVASGIPAFRGTGGLWARYDPERFATEEGLTSLFRNDPRVLKEFLCEWYGVLLKAEPNAVHRILVRLEQEGWVSGVITQNIDDLHRRAGSIRVAQIHGSAMGMRCPHCGIRRRRTPQECRRLLNGLSSASTRRRIRAWILRLRGTCPECRGRLTPAVVLFGQQLPLEPLESARRYIFEAGVLLCVGTSGSVYPAASLPGYARQHAKKVFVVNPEPTALDFSADGVFRQLAADFFEKLSLH
ncbi:MAG: NAD-dependent protein deacylase [Candidatus Omnitrophica bacterium]|nr:NAD-dependent protein deacylase [Candidatus Omnitrophota bacterium]